MHLVFSLSACCLENFVASTTMVSLRKLYTTNSRTKNTTHTTAVHTHTTYRSTCTGRTHASFHCHIGSYSKIVPLAYSLALLVSVMISF